MVGDRQVHVFPTDAAAVALPGAMAGDAVLGSVKLADLVDVDMDELAGLLACVAARRLTWRQRPEFVQASPSRARLTVAGETLVSWANCRAVTYRRRNASWRYAAASAGEGGGADNIGHRGRLAQPICTSTWPNRSFESNGLHVTNWLLRPSIPVFPNHR